MQAASAPRLTTAARGNPPAAGHRRVEPLIWAGAMAVLTAAVLAGEVTSGPVPFLALDVVTGVVCVALVTQLGRWPGPVALVLSPLCAVSPAATAAATMAALVVARWQRLEVALAVAVTGIGAHLIRGVWRPVGGLPYAWWAVLVIAAYAALVGWGTGVRANRALIGSLRERAEDAEAEQARRVAEARAAERTRIAREMHDVLAHRLSLLATYAGALAFRPDAPPGQLSKAAEVVRAGAHQALDELREVIGVLREDEMPDLTAGSRPLPGFAELPELIEESPEITVVNALRPASSPVPQVPGSGTGLIGLTERVELAGGRLDARARDGEFRLRAWLPWPAPDGRADGALGGVS